MSHSDTSFQFYGRRKGRPLRNQLRRLLDEELPRWQLPLPAGANTPLNPADLFDETITDIYLEIGFGGGEHLANLAENAPDTGFIGAEPFVNGVASLLRHIEAGGLQNIRIWPDDVRQILDLLPDGCLAGAYVMFPDPWPKRRHAARRILNPQMMAQLARLIRKEGMLRAASDHVDAKVWLLAEMIDHPDFFWLAEQPSDWQNRPSDWPETRYMAKGVREGRASVWFDFARR